jgi:transcription elongation factor Elf1
MKTCFKCNTEKPLSEFYKHFGMADGHLNKCKQCTKNDAFEQRHGKCRERILSYDRERASQPHRIEKKRAYAKKYDTEKRHQKNANLIVYRALKAGKIQKLPCLICGENSEAHHPDYSKPLDVVWLCSAHHKQAHALTRNENEKSY